MYVCVCVCATPSMLCFWHGSWLFCAWDWKLTETKGISMCPRSLTSLVSRRLRSCSGWCRIGHVAPLSLEEDPEKWLLIYGPHRRIWHNAFVVNHHKPPHFFSPVSLLTFFLPLPICNPQTVENGHVITLMRQRDWQIERQEIAMAINDGY